MTWLSNPIREILKERQQLFACLVQSSDPATLDAWTHVTTDKALDKYQVPHSLCPKINTFLKFLEEINVTYKLYTTLTPIKYVLFQYAMVTL